MPTIKAVDKVSVAPVTASTPPKEVVEFLERPMSTVSDDGADVSLKTGSSPIYDVYSPQDVGFANFLDPGLKQLSSTSTDIPVNRNAFLSADFLPLPTSQLPMNPATPKVVIGGNFELMEFVRGEVGRWQFWVAFVGVLLALGTIGLMALGFSVLVRLGLQRIRQYPIYQQVII
jgi:hypothetical protein